MGAHNEKNRMFLTFIKKKWITNVRLVKNITKKNKKKYALIFKDCPYCRKYWKFQNFDMDTRFLLSLLICAINIIFFSLFSETWRKTIFIPFHIIILLFVSKLDKKVLGCALTELQHIFMRDITREGNTWGLHFGITPADQPRILIPVLGSWTNISSISDYTSSNNI